MGTLTAAASGLSLWVRSKFGSVDRRFDKILERMEKKDDQAAESRRELHLKLDECIKAMNETAVRVGRIEGQISRH